MKKLRFDKTENLIPIISIFCYMIILFLSPDIAEEVHRSLFFCLETIIPAIFTPLAFSFFILSFPLSEAVRRKTEKVLFPAFGLRGNCTQAVFTGLTGGYNIAPKTAVKLLKNGEIGYEQAKRLALFFSSSGFSFAVNITGIAVYNSFTTGLKLFISGITADILIAFIYNRLCRNNERSVSVPICKRSLSEEFTSAVNSCSNAMISICSNIILFSSVKTFLRAVFPLKPFLCFLELFSEVSSAVIYSSKNHSLKITAMCLYFGGFSVFFQQLPDLNLLGISPVFYLLIRILRTAGSVFVFGITELLFPENVAVSALSGKASIHSANPLASFSLLLLCAVFISSVKKTAVRYKNTTGTVSDLQ